MSSENSNFYLGKSHLIIISTLLFFIVNLLASYLYTRYDIPAQSGMASGVFSLIKNLVIHSIFWLTAGRILKDNKNALISLVTAIILSGGLGFYQGTLIRYDNDNLLLRSLVFIIPFYIFGFLHLKKPVLSVALFFMGVVPIANLDLGHRFITNLSFLSAGNLLKLDPANLKMDAREPDSGFLFGLGFDPLTVLVNTFLFFVTVILFFELYRLIRSNFSANLFRSHFNIKNSYSKLYALIAYISLKTLIYYLIASITVIVLGNNNFPLIQNKIAQIIYLKGTVLLLIFCVLYFRKFLSEQLVPNKAFPLSIYLMSLFPVFDYFAWILLMVSPRPNAMQNFRAENKTLGTFKISTLILFVATQVLVVAYFYFAFLKSSQLNDNTAVNAAITQVLIIPVLNIILFIGSYFSLKVSQAFFFFQIIGLIYVALKCLPVTETVFTIEFLSFDITKTLVFIVISFCLIPVLHIRRFYK